jgi:hypothetical protein
LRFDFNRRTRVEVYIEEEEISVCTGYVTGVMVEMKLETNLNEVELRDEEIDNEAGQPCTEMI